MRGIGGREIGGGNGIAVRKRGEKLLKMLIIQNLQKDS
jgi:hypothetical protein